ncbi:integral to membrane protein [Coprinopsis cinerea okayama7|uniref:Integral to membrane protein n=1 Tax=Coprinopsis cinerea (strain Okayama-7 / 130 / ATCC MYA-4618 / FGSC 9003) TaxID=240176 RepID=A8P2G2_COPC7|nr:integral to membrane protein [Coprinopsis cinerea okayama7\|eukprot:XP_001838312.1 integral to membrane protein [Coprinopsis cinerea okayama7\
MANARTVDSGATPNASTLAISQPSTTTSPAKLHHETSLRAATTILGARNVGKPTEEEENVEDGDGGATFWNKAKAKVRSNTGLLLIAASQAFFSLMNVAVKKLNTIDPPVTALQLIVVRMGITYLCCMVYMLAAKIPDPFLGPKGVRILLAFRGFTGFFGLFGIYYSLQYLSLSDATVLTFLSPMCTAVTGALLLGETLTKRQALAGGKSRVFRCAHLRAQRKLQSVALLGVLGATGAYTTIRAIGKRAHPLHVLTSFSSQCVIVAAIGMIVKHESFVIPARLAWLAMLAMIGVFGFLAQVLLTMGLQRETASRGSMAVYTQIVFATIFERVFFNIKPSLLSAIGTSLIIGSAMYVALSKKPDEKDSKPSGNAVKLQRVSEDGMEEGLLSSRDDSGDSDGDEDANRDGGREGRNHDRPDEDDDTDLALPLHQSNEGARS